tara:strand:+ start:144 stop:1046 length:903 start_codon:yes stop_codon:yes gene_type:complete
MQIHKEIVMGKSKELDLEEQESTRIMKFELIDSPIPTITNDLPNGRWYCDIQEKKENRTFLPSVTTILGAMNKGIGYDMWLGNSLSYKHAMEYANELADIGSAVHALCMRMVWGEEVDTRIDFINHDGSIMKLDDRVNKRLVGFIDFIKDYRPRFVATEISLFNPLKDDDGEIVFDWAGQADDIIMVDGKRILLDIKTGKEYQSHSLQLTAYKMLWDSIFPDMPIDELWALYLPEKYRTKSYKIVKYKYEPEMWLNVYDLWIWQNSKRGKRPKPVFKKELETKYTITEELYMEEEDGQEK